MENLLNRLDRLGGIETENKRARLLERVAFVFLILMILSAPHSIAATQTAWLLGMTAWLVSLFFKPRPKFIETPLNRALWAFFFWTAITSVFSYAPEISIDKLRGAAVFLIFFFVLNNLRTVRAAKFLAFALVFSCMASALWSPIERIFGRGVEVSGIAPNSILLKATEFNHDNYLKAKGKNLRAFADAADATTKPMPLADGDAIIELEGEPLRSPEQFTAAIERNEFTYFEYFHAPWYFSAKVRRADLNPTGGGALEKLGVENWRPSRNWRYGGFYGHVITYAEVLQMIASLALGLFVALPTKRSRVGAILIFCIAAFVFALGATFTRSAEIALLASALAMILTVGSRKMLLTLAAVVLPLAVGGFFLLQANRSIGQNDARDDSLNYRQTVYREGFGLWTQDARKFFLGVGMDSIKTHKEEWHLFDNGRLPMGHFHSTPLQLLVERGLPALLLWLWILWLYARTLWRGIRDSRFTIHDSENEIPHSALRTPHLKDWQTLGILLGCFGGLIGFFVSSAVNYSLGDSEVAMVFFMLMGIGIFLSITNYELRITNVGNSSSIRNS